MRQPVTPALDPIEQTCSKVSRTRFRRHRPWIILSA